MICGYQFPDNYVCMQADGHTQRGLKHIHPDNLLDAIYRLGFSNGEEGAGALTWVKEAESADDTGPYDYYVKSTGNGAGKIVHL